MRTIGLLAFAAGALAITLSCGGSGGAGIPTQSPLPDVTASPGPSEAANGSGGQASGTGATIDCDAPLPDGPIALAGIVEYAEIVRSAPVPTLEVGVRVERIETTAEAQDWEYDYVPGELIDVVIVGSIPVDRPGDCVLIAGQIRRWACAADCDAVGLVADIFEVAQP